MDAHSPAWPHSPIRACFDDVFYVIGTNKIHHDGVDLQTSRTMLIVRDGTALTLINSVRLDEAGLVQLEALGTVKHIIRLGAFHGRDDPFYRTRYGACLWALAGSTQGPGEANEHVLSEGSALPLATARLFEFRTAKHPEAALLLARHGGVLVTCDAIQNWTTDDGFFSPATFAMFSAQGLIGEANVPATWLGACEPRREDFERLLALEFRHLVTAHGEPLLHDARARVRASVDRVFGA